MDRRFELAGFGLACAGWICAIFTKCLPMWNVTGTVDNTTDTLALYWDGVWLNWQELNKGSLHCNFYMSLLSLAGSFRSWNALLLASIIMGIFPVVGYFVAFVWFPQRVQIKAAAGVVFVLMGLLLLVVISWATHATYSELDTATHLTKGWGPALYSGWTGTVLLLTGGGGLSAFCCKAPPQEQRGPTGPEADDPFLAIHSAAFNSSPYRQTTRPI
ncbi:claudin-4-like [Colossoma macropomum]|uniref:claudin-4-like n=1 Tax=Colossoma macropomum TaxID=42526 RepID=UPI001863FDFC|nr:claudin-4-like [Colossoma macropomum]